MTKLRHIFSTIIVAITLTGCHDLPDYDNDVQGNFDALWSTIDQHYCFLDSKGIDWNEIYKVYSARLNPSMSREELFNVCSDMLDELRDGHVNLSASFNTSYYRRWWSDYPQNYQERLVEEYYFNFNYRSIGGVNFGILHDNIGYIRYPSFDMALGDGNWDAIFVHLATCDGIIIDVRDNGGGAISNVETLVSRFITSRTLAGYISHKTGPGHSDFSEPFAYYFQPTAEPHIRWIKPVVVLTNRSTYSAANNFVAVMKHVPTATIMGATTGGGSGMPFSSELPCGWGIRFSACSLLDAKGVSTENGVAPTPGCEVDLDPALALDGIDTMIEAAISRICTPQ